MFKKTIINIVIASLVANSHLLMPYRFAVGGLFVFHIILAQTVHIHEDIAFVRRGKGRIIGEGLSTIRFGQVPGNLSRIPSIVISSPEVR